ncbi:MAG: copper homeostasis protein CutC, partial [Chloroflexota bacterium]
MINVEVCINCDSQQSVTEAVSAARLGGASTVELCSAMHFDGLTPREAHISQARDAFKDQPGLMVMIRPREGDFYVSTSELRLMMDQIISAAQRKADGVVFGVLRQKDNTIATDDLLRLVDLCQKYNLTSTFH